MFGPSCAFEPVRGPSEQGWPSKALAFNPTLRLSAGLRGVDAFMRLQQRSRLTRPPPRTPHYTTDDGRLWLSAEMPLLAHRYRFMHALSESDMSQMLDEMEAMLSRLLDSSRPHP